MTDEVKQPDPLDDVVVTLEYTIREINAMLVTLSKAPYEYAYGPINSIHAQVGPQFQKAKASMEAALKAIKDE